MRSIVVFYSRSGNTARVAGTLAENLGAEVFEISCSRYGKGAMGYLRAGYDSMSDYLPPIATAPGALAPTDLLVVAGPVWGGRPAAPLRAFLKRHPRLPLHVAAVLTHGGSALPDAAFSEIEGLARAPLDARLPIRDLDVANDRYGERIRELAQQVREYGEPPPRPSARAA